MADYGELIRRAHKKWELAHDEELPWAEIARRCQTLLQKPVDPSTVIRWKSSKQEPTLSEFEALGTVLDAWPGDLAFDPAKRAAARQEPAAMIARDRLAVPSAKDKKRGA